MVISLILPHLKGIPVLSYSSSVFLTAGPLIHLPFSGFLNTVTSWKIHICVVLYDKKWLRPLFSWHLGQNFLVLFICFILVFAYPLNTIDSATVHYYHVYQFTLWTQSSKERLCSVSNRIPVLFVSEIDRDCSSEGYSISEHDWLFCNSPLSSGQFWFP